jgi:hypothetical protein
MKKMIFTLMSLMCLEKIAQAETQDEKILGYQPTQEGIIFHVTSSGCTKPEDFVVDLSRDDQTRTSAIKLVRTRPDNCYSFIPMGVKISFTFEQLGMQASEAFVVQNKNGVVRGWNWKESTVQK